MSALGLCNSSGDYQRDRYPLPHSPISLAIFLTLEEALGVAWELIHKEAKPPFDPANAQEQDFTAELEEILRDDLLENESVDGFNKEIFHDIVRPEVKNFDGKKVAKRPDMLFKLVDRKCVKPSQDGIFVECKLMDCSGTSKRLYCDNGITRFTEGDYAWAMPEAMMLAYSNDTRMPSVALAESFKTRAKKVLPVGKLKQCLNSSSNPPTAISCHRRNFKLRGRTVQNITIRHLWLQRPA